MHAKEIEMCNGAWLWLHKTFDADDDNLIVMCVSLSRTELNKSVWYCMHCPMTDIYNKYCFRFMDLIDTEVFLAIKIINFSNTIFLITHHHRLNSYFMINEYWFKLVFKDLLFVNLCEMLSFCPFADFIVEPHDNTKNNKKLPKEVYDI